MPVFNAGKYLRFTIKSLQDNDCKDWCLMCVDDGSTDDSVDILKDLCHQDQRIQFFQQENAGPAVARARAIAKANTKYVAILDADDSVSSDFVGKMLQRATETEADIVMPNVKLTDEKGTPESGSHFERQNFSHNMIVENPRQAFALSVSFRLHGWVMMRTDMAKRYYTEENVNYSRFNSDEYIGRLIYLKAKKVALADTYYFYRKNPNSITQVLSERHLDTLKTYDRLVDLCLDEHIDMNTLHGIYSRYRSAICHMSYLVDSKQIRGGATHHRLLSKICILIPTAQSFHGGYCLASV